MAAATDNSLSLVDIESKQGISGKGAVQGIHRCRKSTVNLSQSTSVTSHKNPTRVELYKTHT